MTEISEATELQHLHLIIIEEEYNCSIEKIRCSNIQTIRILLTSVLIFCLLFSTYYSAGLTLSLRFPRFMRKIDSLQDVIDSKIKWFEPNEWMKIWMKNTSNEVIQQFADLFEGFNNITERNAKIKHESYGLLVETIMGVKENQRYVMFSESLDEFGKKHLKIITESIGCFYTVFALKRNSPYVDKFNKDILSFIEFGFTNHWLIEFSGKPEIRYMEMFFQKYSDEMDQLIDMEKLQGAFYFLLVGLILSTVVFFTEYFFKIGLKNEIYTE
ncbi:uncharacterized protein LOC135265879 [Tribolium castaneum]|uniref:uncharacterized protein LOC135265879 n=1 Tax=Tribolium castaneum TaxID=7070 RepID=UPI0030FF2849